jgi:hypothetical protein
MAGEELQAVRQRNKTANRFISGFDDIFSPSANQGGVNPIF